MKKLLGILVLGLLWCNVGLTEILELDHGIKINIPKELNEIDDELKAIYHSKDTVCFYIFKTRDLRNEFVEKTKGMEKTQREEIYKQYLI